MAKNQDVIKVNAHLIALQHELRRRIMQVFDASDEPISPREVSEWLDKPLPNVSYHVRVLADCKAIILVHTEPVRGSMQHFYRPDPSFIGQAWVADVLGISPAARIA
jgi:DNA-binding transcriptional ArsR family regulator